MTDLSTSKTWTSPRWTKGERALVADAIRRDVEKYDELDRQDRKRICYDAKCYTQREMNRGMLLQTIHFLETAPAKFLEANRQNFADYVLPSSAMVIQVTSGSDGFLHLAVRELNAGGNPEGRTLGDTVRCLHEDFFKSLHRLTDETGVLMFRLADDKD